MTYGRKPLGNTSITLTMEDNYSWYPWCILIEKILNILLAHWIKQQIKITPWPSKILYLEYKFVKHMTISASYQRR